MASEWILPTALRHFVTSVAKKREKQEPRVIRDVTLDGLDKRSKEAIIRYLKQMNFNVENIDDDMYTVDMTNMDVERHKEFLDFLETLENRSEGDFVLSESKESKSETTGYPCDAMRSEGNTLNDADVEETSDEDSSEPPEPYPRPMHPIDEMRFDYLNPRVYPVELLNNNGETDEGRFEERRRSHGCILRRLCRRIKECSQKTHMGCIRCMVYPCSKICWLVFTVMSKISEKRHNQKMKKMQHAEKYQTYPSVVKNQNPFVNNPKALREFVDTGINTYPQERMHNSVRDHSTMTDPPRLQNVGVNTIYFTNCPKSAYTMSILSPKILSLADMTEEQKVYVEKGVNAVPQTSNVEAYTCVPIPNFVVSDTFDTRELYPDRTDIDEVEESSVADVGCGCPCEAVTGVFKGLNRYVNTPRLADDSTSTAFTDELLRQQREITEVKKMLHSAILILNKKYT